MRVGKRGDEGSLPRSRHRRGHTGTRLLMYLALMFIIGTWGPAQVSASTAYGDLNNFDVFNDTGEPCHGFEIELDDIHSTDITYTYDWNHYGAPTISEDDSDPAHPKVFIRYASKYSAGTFTAFTAVPSTAPSPTDGHMCTNPAVNIGCEHFGVGYYGNPTVVKYNWLLEDPTSPGTLKHGPMVNVATPSWTYYPAAPAQPVAQVQAVILAPPPPPAPVYEFGDAVWVKAIVTTSHRAEVVELKDLISDDPDDPNDKNWRNGEPDEVEVEWQILQTEFNNPAGANNDLAGALEELPDGDEVITRRYEFYKYTGPFDPESHEAKCTKYPQISNPADPKYKATCDPALVTVVGDYIGAQMAGFNVEAVLGLIDHVQDGDIYEPYTPRTVVVGGNTPYVATVTAGTLPPDLVLDSTTGILSGAPSTPGEYSFTITATDADLAVVSKAYTMRVAGPPDPCDGVVCEASDPCHDTGTCDPDTGTCSDPPKVDMTPCDDGNPGTCGDACVGGACQPGAACVVPYPVCPAAPAEGCLSSPSGKSLLAIGDNATTDRKDKVQWSWSRGSAIGFGDPVGGSTGYSLCIYDFAGGAPLAPVQISVSSGANWKRTAKGALVYKNPVGDAGGVTKLVLTPSAAGKAKIALGAKGKTVTLPLPAPISGTQFFSQQNQVVVQFHSSDGGCWGSTYQAPALANAPNKFRDKND